MALEVDIEKRVGAFRLRAAFAADGGIMGLLGASGCGKSMTLRCIAGIDKPDRGRIALDGRVLFDSERRVNLPPRQRRVGYLFQSYALFPGMTARQNILCGLHAEPDKAKREARADEVMALLGIRGLAAQRPASLSGGQAQLVALARILANAPDVLLMDEPFSALDAHLRLRLQMELRELLSGYGRGVVMVTHDRDEAYRMCDRLGVMDRGRVLAVKPTRELFSDPGTRAAAAITGCKNIAEARIAGAREVFVPAWNVCLVTERPVGDGLVAVGVRAHDFGPEIADNRFPVRFLRDMEEPFAWVSEFRYEAQPPDGPALWWRYARGDRPAAPPPSLGVAPGDVLPLYGE